MITSAPTTSTIDARRARGPSTALALGIMAGVLAAVAVLPTLVPVVFRTMQAERYAYLSRIESTVAITSSLLDKGYELEDFDTDSLNIQGLQLLTNESSTLVGEELTLPKVRALCESKGKHAGYLSQEGQNWAAACRSSERGLLIAYARSPEFSLNPFGVLFLGLALMVGISTALGVLHLLSPIAQVSKALKRLEQGGRELEVEYTGLREIDRLISHLKRASIAIWEREDEIHARYRVVQQVSRVVAHEIRNPLQSLELLSTLIAQEPTASEREALRKDIHTEIAGLDATVRRLLRESDDGQLHLNRTEQSLNALIEETVGLRTIQAREHRVSLKYSPGEAISLSLDRTLFLRVIDNLIINALQHAPKPGGIIEISTTTTNTHVQLIVEDNGPGVSPDLGNAIYEQNISFREGGTGLGLSLVHSIVQAHGGIVGHGRSGLGGARFVVEFPRKRCQGETHAITGG